MRRRNTTGNCRVTAFGACRKNGSGAKVMHCLPVRRNVEFSDEVMDSENSIIYQ
ncbi:hypothetical protein [Chryseobacterium sp. MP_3.2]|uniref:hypothetical protein n=1 Tax=Chryseobacterium sp. MP_3.2 TaxID=3071712 RepID=UPI003FA3D5E0